MEQKTYQMQNFAAVQGDGNGVLGKVLYYSLSNILIDREEMAALCASVGFPYQPTNRSARADAFRSATGDVYERLADFQGVLPGQPGSRRRDLPGAGQGDRPGGHQRV